MSAEAWVEVRALVPHGWEELVAGILSGAGCQGAREGSSAPNPAPLPLGMSLVRSHFRARADSPERREALCEAVASLGEIDEELRAVELSFRVFFSGVLVCMCRRSSAHAGQVPYTHTSNFVLTREKEGGGGSRAR